MKIAIDTRESDKEFVSHFKEEAIKRGYEVEESALEFGDICCGDIYIERKTINDLASSITSPRLWSQVLKMKANPSYVCMVIISGDLEDLNYNNLEKIPEIYGGIAKLMRLGVPVHTVEDDKLLTKRVLDLLEHSEEIDIPIKHVKKMDGMGIIRSFPSTGPKTVEIIKKKFSTTKEFLEFVISSSEEELRKEFGKSKGSKFFNSIRERIC